MKGKPITKRYLISSQIHCVHSAFHWHTLTLPLTYIDRKTDCGTIGPSALRPTGVLLLLEYLRAPLACQLSMVLNILFNPSTSANGIVVKEYTSDERLPMMDPLLMK